jgi:hypothetical protein
MALNKQKIGKVRTQMHHPGDAGLVLVPVLFAAGLAQAQAPVSVATRLDVLDSCRRYSDSIGFKSVCDNGRVNAFGDGYSC